MKWIYVIIGILAIVLIYLLVKGQQSSTTGNRTFLGTSTPSDGTTQPYSGSPNVGAYLDELSQTISPVAESEDCGKTCRQLCKAYPPAILCKDRCQCKRNCKSDCAKGLDYRSMYP